MNLRQYLQLIWFRSVADLRAERQRTYLGLLWWVLEPVLFMAVFYVVFGHIRGAGGPEFVAFLLTGLVLWQWFRSVISHSGNSIHAGLRLMRQVPLPPAVFPLITVLSDTLKFLIVLALLLAALPMLGIDFDTSVLLLAPVILVELMLIMGLALIYAAIVPFIPDLKYMIDTALLALMFLSGIFYPIESVQGRFQWLITLNPMAGIIDDARKVLLHGLAPEWLRLGMIALVAIALIVIGTWLTRQLSPHYTKLPA